MSARAESLDEWVNLCEYIVKIVPVFRDDVAPLRAFGAGISAPFEGESLAPFAEWYRKAAARGCRLRCVFEDTGMYRHLVRDLQIKGFTRASSAIATKSSRSSPMSACRTSTSSGRPRFGDTSTRCWRESPRDANVNGRK